MNRIFATAMLVLVASTQSQAETVVDVEPLPFDEFTEVVEQEDVSISPETKAAVADFVADVEPLPEDIHPVAALVDTDSPKASLKFLFPLLTHEHGQAVSETLLTNRDPKVRFLAGCALAASGNSDAAELVHAIIHEPEITLQDKRALKTLSIGMGIRVASDDASAIQDHLIGVMGNEPKLKHGEVPPEFVVKTSTGRSIDSRALSGKIVVLHFWSTSCGPCMYQIPSHLNSLAAYEAEDVEVLFVSLDHDEEAFEAAVEKHGMRFHNVREPEGWGGALTRSFGVNALPFDVIIGRDGKVASNDISEIPSLLDQGGQ